MNLSPTFKVAPYREAQHKPASQYFRDGDIIQTIDHYGIERIGFFIEKVNEYEIKILTGSGPKIFWADQCVKR